MAGGEAAPGMTRRRTRIYAGISILLGLSVGFAALEFGLGYLRQQIERSDRVDRGMMTYDPQLGWRPTPIWRGRHVHYDFDVGYTINSFGFRGAFKDVLADHKTRRIAVLGDSFTFGLGVDDGQTFVDELDRRAARHEIVLNLGVPGYSTDQEVLLAERALLRFRPSELMLVVYLGNDLIDNELPFPVQGLQAKPYFQPGPQGLTLRNTPVPMVVKSGADAARSFGTVVLAGMEPPGRLARAVSSLETVRRLGIEWPPPRPLFPGAEPRFQTSVELFVALASRLREMAARRNARLHLVLLPGRSVHAAPGSYSAQYQDHVRKEILARAGAIGTPVIDVASRLREQFGEAGVARLYYRNDGHLTAEGHRAVADILAPSLGL